jgi:regulator of extracellular matrix RemA (YlzA/DUF370 family)
MLAHIGYKNFIATGRVVAVVPYNSAPARRIRGDAIDEGRHVDCTNGNKTASIIVLDNRTIVSSAFSTEVVAGRVENAG